MLTAALLLSSCVIKNNRPDFTWLREGAAPTVNDQVVLDNRGPALLNTAPAPSIVKEPPPEPEVETGLLARQAQEEAARRQEEETTRQKEISAAPTAVAAAAPAPVGIYTIQSGDTLSKIAKRYGTTVDALCRANGISKTQTLHINQQLRLSAATPLPVAQTVTAKPVAKTTPAPAPRHSTTKAGTYTIQSGDTLYGIARRYGINAKALMQANGITPESAGRLRIGGTLTIPSK